MGKIYDGTKVVDETVAQAKQTLADKASFANPPADLLIARAKDRQVAVIDSGFAFDVGSAEEPKVILADLSTDGRTDMNGLVALADKDPTFTTVWIQSTGKLSLDAKQIQDLGVAVGLYYQSTYTVLGDVIAKIESGGIKTFADVDAAPWPKSSQ